MAIAKRIQDRLATAKIAGVGHTQENFIEKLANAIGNQNLTNEIAK